MMLPAPAVIGGHAVTQPYALVSQPQS